MYVSQNSSNMNLLKTVEKTSLSNHLFFPKVWMTCADSSIPIVEQEKYAHCTVGGLLLEVGREWFCGLIQIQTVWHYNRYFQMVDDYILHLEYYKKIEKK